MKEYEIAFVKSDGSLEIVGRFFAEDDYKANRMMENDWYLLRNGQNVNDGGQDSWD